MFTTLAVTAKFLLKAGLDLKARTPDDGATVSETWTIGVDEVLVASILRLGRLLQLRVG